MFFVQVDAMHPEETTCAGLAKTGGAKTGADDLSFPHW